MAESKSENTIKNLLTPEGRKKIERRIKYLKEVRRPEIAEIIQRAKELGDLSENAEYHSAKEEQAQLEGEIVRLTNILRSSEIVQPERKDGRVNIGSKVKLVMHGREQVFSIVGEEEVDALNGAISYRSPLGQALVGHKAGDTFSIETPKGETRIKILSVE